MPSFTRNICVAFRWLATLWVWPVIGVGAPFLYGCGVGALFGDEYFLARVLFAIALLSLTAKTVSSEEIRRQESSRYIVAALILTIFLIPFALSAWWVSYRAQAVSKLASAAAARSVGAPEFTVRSEYEFLTQRRDQMESVYLITGMDISNRGGPGTVASITVDLEISGRVYSSSHVLPPPRDSMLPLYHDDKNHGTIKLRGYQYWTYAVGEKPVQPNTSTAVWALAKFEGITPADINGKRASINVKIADVQGRISTFSEPLIPSSEVHSTNSNSGFAAYP